MQTNLNNVKPRLKKSRSKAVKSFPMFTYLRRNTPFVYLFLQSMEWMKQSFVVSMYVHWSLHFPSLERVFQEEQYAKWMAAFRLASKGRSIGEPSYETERESILALLNMQRPSSNPQQTKFDIQPENFVSIKFVKKYKIKQVCFPFNLSPHSEIFRAIHSIPWMIAKGISKN